MKKVNHMPQKIALVTGGSSGISRATAIKLVNQGYQVFITGRKEVELLNIKNSAKNPENIISIVVDFNKSGFEKEISLFIKKSVGEYVKIDRLIHCAAIIGPIDKLTNLESRLAESMHINAYAPLILTHELLPLCNPNTRVSFMSSNFMKPAKITPFIDIFDAYISSKIVLLTCIILSYPFFKGKILIEIPILISVKDKIIYNYFLIKRLQILVNNSQKIKSSLDQEKSTKLKDETLKQAPVNKKSTEVVTFIKNQLKPDDNLSQLINAEVEKILKLAIVPKGYSQDYLLNRQYPIENLLEQMNQEKEFKILSDFLKENDSYSGEPTTNKMKLPEFVADGIEELSKELPGILPAEIVAMLTKNSTCESLFNKINSILEKETQTKNTPISKITGNPHATFQLQTHSDSSIAPPASNLNHFSLN